MDQLIYRETRAKELLRIGSGYADAEFRDGQNEAIRHVVEAVSYTHLTLPTTPYV